MIVNTNQMLSVSEANQNFSKATKLADQNGSIILLKNNRPSYMLISLRENPEFELSDEEKIDVVARRVLERHRKAFEELAK
ncbi:MAG: type II toxin-antitoxin system prevent-host-death family antitoxin [Bacillota bacterium]|uniref:Type II toxin-antitoxin system Phd/YefM family antitoxin n=1 Tax=Candidatus Gallimonas intestinavium TaxID=2838603 RepID=A0A9D2K0G2_9FIRM|nr:MAG: type II toxin-antitoxin system prevent-host-death family antitoxin [Bacillota bacterium]HIZ72609.1 type II toxin-antitoxin system Phd/YefM family antitoxin [Candidatus Gallimonas intestinavium]